MSHLNSFDGFFVYVVFRFLNLLGKKSHGG